MKRWPSGPRHTARRDRLSLVPRSPELLAADAYNAYLPSLECKWSALLEVLLLGDRPVRPRGAMNGRQLYGVPPVATEIGGQGDVRLQKVSCVAYGVLARDSVTGRRALAALWGERLYDNVEVHPSAKEALLQMIGRDTVAVCVQLFPVGPRDINAPESYYDMVGIPFKLQPEETAARVSQTGLSESVAYYKGEAASQSGKMTIITSMLQGPTPPPLVHA